MDLGQVEPRYAKERCAHIKRGSADLPGLRADPGQIAGIMILIGGQGLSHRLKIAATFQHPGLIEVVKVQRLRQRKDVLRSIIAVQGRFDRLDRGVATNIAIGCQDFQITFARDEGPNDAHACEACGVGCNMVKLKVHLHQRLLHVPNVGGCVFYRPFALAQISRAAAGHSLG